ncbi:glycine--tRNA ligase subunit beta [Secundilactobacillus similis DSM 23365 = JCM 2765]|uniref:Glycine--tRNA ligase beta subunit n=1 Tax=Secundilactobacillus similis DSM 23365 = JCM 2765 TaxID=1423804 RepID=A0A0R2EQY5_9LACO|nr:glycine--tRNA ligase subunit beta [Secundilactobacillus similis]KRN18545.1 glycyl-tRNA synthetase subunit beta [Secundilactobacillus similis DSM 23365 = JCM 2765]
MAHTFLLEIGLEEMPAHVVTPSIKQLVQKTKKYLKDERISFDDIKSFSTPRRLAIQLTGLADKQPDVDEEVKGPAKKIALDKDGNWSKAAQGFTRGQGVTVDDITFKELKGTEYVYVNKHIAGQPVESVLAGLKDVITGMTFPTMMKWGSYHFEYIRPIKWLVALLDDKVIPFQILDVATDRETRGHRFLGKTVTLNTATDYEAALTSEFVIADAAKRKAEIRTQIDRLATDNNWVVKINEDLLEEVTNLVEWPTAFAGGFDDKYLAIPDEVLITSMRDHQRFFYVSDKAGKLLPHFISVRNGNDNHLENVISGNEKVLAARLSDAMFFYEEDQKQTINDYVERLKTVSFHDKISTMYEKMQRVTAIAGKLGQTLGLTEAQLKDVTRAAQIYKFDLVTGMVGEFAELQGVMGEKYALLNGETPAVAQAVREHYMPISADGDLPASTEGAVLALADKLDSILTFFAAGMVPSGSNDPYALRRQATGIVRIIRANDWHFDQDLVNAAIAAETAANVAPKLDQAAQVSAVEAFLKDRIKVTLLGEKVKHDVVDAVIEGPNTDLLDNFTAAQVLSDHQTDDDFKGTIEALNRVLRLAQKADADKVTAVDPALFENDSEKGLYDAVNEVAAKAAGLAIPAYYNALAGLKPAINAYFEATMVMADDEKVKNNRLSQLSQLAQLILRLGDLNQLIVK